MTYGTANWPRLCKVLPKRTWSLCYIIHGSIASGTWEKCALCPLTHLVPITRVLRHLSGAVLFCHYHCTAYKSKTHFSYFFLIFVYSGITPNTTSSFFPWLSQKKMPKYAPKWPVQHLNQHQITLRFSFKQNSLLGPVSCKQIKVEQLWWRQDRSCCSVSPRILGASLIHFSFLLAPILREPKISRKRNPTNRPLHLHLVNGLKIKKQITLVE